MASTREKTLSDAADVHDDDDFLSWTPAYNDLDTAFVSSSSSGENISNPLFLMMFSSFGTYQWPLWGLRKAIGGP